jgi:hypothetical protein
VIATRGKVPTGASRFPNRGAGISGVFSAPYRHGVVHFFGGRPSRGAHATAPALAAVEG